MTKIKLFESILYW